MSKYEDMLERLLRSLEKRDGSKPDQVSEKYEPATREGMMREAVCQILADESLSARLKMFSLFPELVIPYLFRIRRAKKKKVG